VANFWRINKKYWLLSSFRIPNSIYLAREEHLSREISLQVYDTEIQKPTDKMKKLLIILMLAFMCSSVARADDSDGALSALKLLRSLAEKGNSNAQNIIGAMYFQGNNGVPQDYVRAYMWFNFAARNGNRDGGKARDIIASKMTRAEIDKAQDMVRECVKKKYKNCD